MSALAIAAAIVFVLNAAGSFIEFNNRFVNALVDTVLFAVVFGVLLHFGYLHMDFAKVPPATTTTTAPAGAAPRGWSSRPSTPTAGSTCSSATPASCATR